MTEKEEQGFYKIGTFGESRVGKTCIIKRYALNVFNKQEESTVCPNILNKEVLLGKKKYTLKIWDTAGQERYNQITKQYYQGLDGLFIVYDVTNQESFDKISFWLENIRETIDINSVAIIILGNKSDLPDRVISQDMGVKYAQSLGFEHFEVSALSNQNIKEAFNQLLDILIQRKRKPKKNSYINSSESKKKGCCS